MFDNFVGKVYAMYRQSMHGPIVNLSIIAVLDSIFNAIFFSNYSLFLSCVVPAVDRISINFFRRRQP